MHCGRCVGNIPALRLNAGISYWRDSISAAHGHTNSGIECSALRAYSLMITVLQHFRGVGILTSL